jgi:hypothetical protein
MADNEQELQIKFPEELIGGVYANNMIITHTREEFIMDFIMAAPPAGTVNARVILSPGHVKRILGALQENIRKYEEMYGEINEGFDSKKENINFTH